MLKEKTNVNYKGRLKATHESQEMLEAIAEGMDKTFAAPYVDLLTKVNKSLSILKPVPGAYIATEAMAK